MVSRPRLLALAFLIAALVCLTSCQRVSANQNTQTISIKMNADGTCQQNGSSGVIDINNTQPVSYQGAATLSQFQVQFSTCPFTSCPVNSPTGAAVNVGVPTGTVGTTYNISAMTINNQQCKSVSGMGLRQGHGP